MQVKQSGHEAFFAQAAYDELYRFRLWLAAVEDSATLGMGFRAYHSHIGRSLAFWKQQGIQFLNPRAEPLWFDALKEDDLWGFLGKREDEPSGPKRKIQATKLAILDVYFKKRFPAVASTFGKRDVSFELSNAIKLFYPSMVSHDEDEKKFRKWSGIYIPESELVDVAVFRRAKLTPLAG